METVRTRIPAGIDLEDRLLYGLSPARLGYVAGFAVLILSVWRLHGVPVAAKLLLCLPLVLAGAAAGWLSFHGRHLDAWAADGGRFLLAEYRLDVDLGHLLRRPRRPLFRVPRAEARRLESAPPLAAPAPLPEPAVILIATTGPP